MRARERGKDTTHPSSLQRWEDRGKGRAPGVCAAGPPQGSARSRGSSSLPPKRSPPFPSRAPRGVRADSGGSPGRKSRARPWKRGRMATEVSYQRPTLDDFVLSWRAPSPLPSKGTAVWEVYSLPLHLSRDPAFANQVSDLII